MIILIVIILYNTNYLSYIHMIYNIIFQILNSILISELFLQKKAYNSLTFYKARVLHDSFT